MNQKLAIPSGWSTSHLGDLAEVRLSSVDKKCRAGEHPVKLCNYLDVYENDYLRANDSYMDATATRSEIGRFRLAPGDVIITKDSETPDDIGVVAVVDSVRGTVVCGYHLALIRPASSVNSLFLTKQLGHDRAQSYFGKIARGTTRYALPAAELEALSLLVPPLQEQEAVSKVLRVLDEAVSATEKVIAKLKLVKQGLLRDLLTRGIDESGALRPPPDNAPQLFKDSSIGKIPGSWDCSMVEAELDVQPGLTLGPHRVPQQSPFPYLRVANVFKGRLDLSDVAYLNARPNEVQHMLLQAGDLLLVEGHANIEEIGRVALTDERVAGLTYQNHLFRLRPRTLEPGFCEMWMNGPWVRSYWRRMCSTSSGLNTINQQTLKAISIPIPPREERLRMMGAASTCSKRITAEQDVLRSHRQLKAGLTDDLLTGRVRAAATTGVPA